ncbi:MAG: 16S rRNA (adenine1518-N6/adenine1519-N6)-dimethyltransferase [Hyphomonadaceae bacterium]|nr:MAG: 16S rRNA (adenine1518-N6/adenine1519-N6)-dimethyltransferase [Hyphomonadaceae bacterium]
MANKSSLGEVLKTNDLFAKKGLGQHFLLDLNLTSKIAKLGAISENDVVFEIGPGPGGLTRALLDGPAHKIIVIEKDPRFARHLRDYFADDMGRLIIIEGDALKISLSEILAEHGLTNYHGKIISNLPYNVGTALLVNWLHGIEAAWPMILMFQSEVATRICANVGQSAYGRLAILVAAKCDAHIALHVPRLAFTPPPKVESAVVVLSEKQVQFDDIAALGKVTAAAFGQRRKMLRSSLGQIGNALALCTAADIDPTKRAETLTPEQFFALANAYKATS